MDASDNRSLKWVCAQIASMDYAEALDLQRRLVSARIAGNLDRNAVLVLEHSPVFTLGRRGGLENLKVPESFLETIRHSGRSGRARRHDHLSWTRTAGGLSDCPSSGLENARGGLRGATGGGHDTHRRRPGSSG